MASQFAPEALNIIDDGAAPVIFIDGLAVYSEDNGIIRTVFYANQPIIESGMDPSAPCKHARVVVLKLIYTAATQTVMRRQLVQQLAEGVRPAAKVGVLHA